MRSEGGSSARTGLYVGADWWIHLSTYEDRTPILDIDAGSASVALSVTDRKVDAATLNFARELAKQAAKFAQEVERLHAAQAGNGSSTGDGEAA
jgi:hypothetical protein